MSKPKIFIAIGIIVAAIVGVGVVTGQNTSACVTGGAVPSDNTGLVADCETLLAMKTALRGSGKLNWWTGRSIEKWDGVKVQSGRVTEFSLPNRSLNGVLPARLGNLSALKTLDLSSNSLTGSIPSELGNLANLTRWRLGGNSLTGCVPANLSLVGDNDLAALGLSVCGGTAPSPAATSTPTPTSASSQPTTPTPTPTPASSQPTTPSPPVDLSAIESRLNAIENRLNGIDGKITKIENDINRLRATITPVPVPDGKPIELSGSGSATERIDLAEGLWSVRVSVRENEDCSEGYCSTNIFEVDVASVAAPESKSLAYEYERDWEGSRAVRVGHGYTADLAPGRQIVTVTADGEWEITFLKEG